MLSRKRQARTIAASTHCSISDSAVEVSNGLRVPRIACTSNAQQEIAMATERSKTASKKTVGHSGKDARRGWEERR
jgi:hypothetical protein